MCNFAVSRLRRAIFKDVRLGGTLHNVKASSMLCQLAVLNVRNSRLMVKDNVGSDCYWYARKRTGVCIEGIIYPQHTFPRIRATYWRRQKLHSFTIKGNFSRPRTTDELKCRPARFCFVVIEHYFKSLRP